MKCLLCNATSPRYRSGFGIWIQHLTASKFPCSLRDLAISLNLSHTASKSEDYPPHTNSGSFSMLCPYLRSRKFLTRSPNRDFIKPARLTLNLLWLSHRKRKVRLVGVNDWNDDVDGNVDRNFKKSWNLMEIVWISQWNFNCVLTR